MEVSKYFFNILKSIDYHIGHLPRDLFANEEQLPELIPIFTWFINNVTPALNCVTPKELTLYVFCSFYSLISNQLKNIFIFTHKLRNMNV